MERYIKKIRSTRSYNRTRAKADSAENALKEADIMRDARKRKYSANTYMGTNKG